MINMVDATGLEPVSQSGQEDENSPFFLGHPKAGELRRTELCCSVGRNCEFALRLGPIVLLPLQKGSCGFVQPLFEALRSPGG